MRTVSCASVCNRRRTRVSIRITDLWRRSRPAPIEASRFTDAVALAEHLMPFGPAIDVLRVILL